MSALARTSLSFFQAKVIGELLLLAAEHVKRMSLPTTAMVVSGWVMICGFGKSSRERTKCKTPVLFGRTPANVQADKELVTCESVPPDTAVAVYSQIVVITGTIDIKCFYHL